MVRAVSPGTNPQGIEMTITAQRATDAESQAGAEGSFGPSIRPVAILPNVESGKDSRMEPVA